jgi:hypothetical protein
MMQFLVVLVVAFVLGVSGFAQQPETGPLLAPSTVIIDVGPRTTALYHRDTCPWLTGAARQVFTLEEAKKRYFHPHCLCLTGKDGESASCSAAVESLERSSSSPSSNNVEAPAANNQPAVSSGSSSSGTVHVRGYTRKDGTYVKPHTRRAPGSRKK